MSLQTIYFADNTMDDLFCNECETSFSVVSNSDSGPVLCCPFCGSELDTSEDDEDDSNFGDFQD